MSCGCLLTKLPLGHAGRNRALARYKREAKKKGREWGLTDEEAFGLFTQDCYYCGAPPANVISEKKMNGDYIFQGIDRVDNAKGYILSNVVPCCKTCNVAKNDSPQADFLDWVLRVCEHQGLYE